MSGYQPGMLRVYLYALTVAFSMVLQNNIRKVLILNGETRSRVYSPKDRKTAFLFGDAGVAALIEKGDRFSESFFSLNTDGARESLIKIKAGGYRYPSSVESLAERVVDDHGNIRNDEQGYMDGESVFNFVAREVPKDIRRVMAFSGCSESQIDYYVFHQANRFMNDFLVKKLKLPPVKVLSTIEKYGNTSSVSVPLTIISELKGASERDMKLCLSAFGVGLSWASAIIALQHCRLSDIQEL
jgi:3-oxoacyl-[acyl-carrier-protein] synthase III